VAKAKASKKKAKPKKENVIIRYLRDTRTELHNVQWPGRQEAWNLTKIVLVVTVSMATLLFVVDRLFEVGIGGIIAGSAIAVGVAVVAAAASVLIAVILARQRA
jgi:preprotein translocase SecE subunit